tara:strand:+ start:2219 stop:2848 length:630 start_codon:yes stop_codon:yes gene_type:complete
MKAIILSSGKGKRMMPLTKDTPKPMLDINGVPLLLNKIKVLEEISIEKIFINVAYKKNVIKNFVSTLNNNIQIIDEGDEPLGTAAGIRNIITHFQDETFMVINSDIWTNYTLNSLKNLNLNDDLAHIILIKTPDYLKGDFDINDTNIMAGKEYTFSGIGKYHRELFMKHDNKELGDILRIEDKIGFSIFSGEWMDIGTPERLDKIRKLR